MHVPVDFHFSIRNTNDGIPVSYSKNHLPSCFAMQLSCLVIIGIAVLFQVLVSFPYDRKLSIFRVDLWEDDEFKICGTIDGFTDQTEPDAFKQLAIVFTKDAPWAEKQSVLLSQRLRFLPEWTNQDFERKWPAVTDDGRAWDYNRWELPDKRWPIMSRVTNGNDYCFSYKYKPYSQEPKDSMDMFVVDLGTGGNKTALVRFGNFGIRDLKYITIDQYHPSLNAKVILNNVALEQVTKETDIKGRELPMFFELAGKQRNINKDDKIQICVKDLHGTETVYISLTKQRPRLRRRLTMFLFMAINFKTGTVYMDYTDDKGTFSRELEGEYGKEQIKETFPKTNEFCLSITQINSSVVNGLRVEFADNLRWPMLRPFMGNFKDIHYVMVDGATYQGSRNLPIQVKLNDKVVLGDVVTHE